MAQNKLARKKILIVSECFYPEEFKINDVAFKWSSLGYDVDVLTMVPSYPFGKIFSGYKNKIFSQNNFKGVTVHRIYTITGYKNSFFKKILRFLNFSILGSVYALYIGRKYDFIFGFNAGALTSMLPAVIISKIYKKPLTFWVQDLWPESLYAYGFPKNKFTDFILQSFVKYVHSNLYSIAISSVGFKKKIKSYLKNKEIKISYIPNWADELKSDKSKFVFANKSRIQFTFAGNIGKQQNLENVINGFLKIPKEPRNKASLNIIGEGGHLNNLKALVKSNDQIFFYGRKESHEMANYYNSSDFLIISLIDDPVFSLTVPSKTQTYLAAKKPILAIIKGETSDLISRYNLGLTSNPSNIGDISDLFLNCINMNEDKRKTFIKNNEILLNKKFNKEKNIKELLKTLGLDKSL